MFFCSEGLVLMRLTVLVQCIHTKYIRLQVYMHVLIFPQN
jgi:hypothetical protein